MLLTAAGLCHNWHRHLAASFQGKLRIDHPQRQLSRSISAVHRGRRSHPDHWILRLLWSDHGKSVHAVNGQCLLLKQQQNVKFCPHPTRRLPA